MKGVLEGCWEAHQTGETLDADGRLRTRGRKAIIQEMRDEAYAIYRAKRIGMGLGDCTVFVNEFMRANGRGDGVSYGAVRRFVAGSTVAELKKRCTKKSSKDDLALPPEAHGGLRAPCGPGFCSRGPQGGSVMPVSGVVKIRPLFS